MKHSLTLSSSKIESAERSFLRADRSVRWAGKFLSEMLVYGESHETDDIERTFASYLSLISTAHENLSSSAKSLELREWRALFNGLRSTDALLHYMWKARDVCTHDSLVGWTTDLHQVLLENVDLAKIDRIPRSQTGRLTAQEMMFFIFECSSDEELDKKLKQGVRPTQERLHEAGVALVNMAQSLVLLPIKFRERGIAISVQVPVTHLGRPCLSTPSATTAATLTLNFYRAKLGELQQAVNAARNQHMPAAQS